MGQAMNRCEWVGPICTSYKYADRIGGFTFVTGGRTLTLSADTYVEMLTDGVYVDRVRLTDGETITPIIEPGQEIVQRRGCAKRQGHRGDHGTYLWRRLLRKVKR